MNRISNKYATRMKIRYEGVWYELMNPPQVETIAHAFPGDHFSKPMSEWYSPEAEMKMNPYAHILSSAHKHENSRGDTATIISPTSSKMKQ